MRAMWNGQVIAESDDTVVVEGNHYFPRESVVSDYLSDSAKTSVCPWKGTASYFTLTVDGQQNPDAAWYYPSHCQQPQTSLIGSPSGASPSRDSADS